MTINGLRSFALPLAFIAIGDGRGIAQPFWDGTWYWLHDQIWEREGKRRSAWYQISGRLGAQLHSVEFTTPRAGEEREIFGYRIRVFSTGARRRGPIVETSWCFADLPTSLDEVHAYIREARTALQNWQGY